MISTATAVVNANAVLSPVPSQKPSVAVASTKTTGTNTAETRSASRWTGALPAWASDTSRAIWPSAVSDPTRVARTTSRPPAFTVAPTTSSPGPTSNGDGLAGQQAPVQRRVALLDHAVGGHLLARPDQEAGAHGQLRDRDPARAAVLVQHLDVLGPELHQRLQRRPGVALGPGLEPAPGQDQRGHHGGRLQVDVVGALAPLGDQVERHPHVGHAGLADEQRVQRPQPRRQHADADQRVHRRLAVAQVDPRRAVEGPRAPQHDRGGQVQRQPLPVVELQRGHHRDGQHRQRQRGAGHQPAQQGVGGGARPRESPGSSAAGSRAS